MAFDNMEKTTANLMKYAFICIVCLLSFDTFHRLICIQTVIELNFSCILVDLKVKRIKNQQISSFGSVQIQWVAINNAEAWNKVINHSTFIRLAAAM